jgi:hypothetical protein
MSEFETVHTMTDFYDGPRGGVADFRCEPHVYESQFSDAINNYTDDFHLSPISDAVFQLALEDWEIWLRWHAAFERGETDQETHPVLPEDRERHDEVEKQLAQSLMIDRDNFLVAKAEFRNVNSNLEVRWSVESVNT